MDRLKTELMVLTMLSALLCGLALIYDQLLATAVFAAITCLALVKAMAL